MRGKDCAPAEKGPLSSISDGGVWRKREPALPGTCTTVAHTVQNDASVVGTEAGAPAIFDSRQHIKPKRLKEAQETFLIVVQ